MAKDLFTRDERKGMRDGAKALNEQAFETFQNETGSRENAKPRIVWAVPEKREDGVALFAYNGIPLPFYAIHQQLINCKARNPTNTGNTIIGHVVFVARVFRERKLLDFPLVQPLSMLKSSNNGKRFTSEYRANDDGTIHSEDGINEFLLDDRNIHSIARILKVKSKAIFGQKQMNYCKIEHVTLFMSSTHNSCDKCQETLTNLTVKQGSESFKKKLHQQLHRTGFNRNSKPELFITMTAFSRYKDLSETPLSWNAFDAFQADKNDSIAIDLTTITGSAILVSVASKLPFNKTTQKEKHGYTDFYSDSNRRRPTGVEKDFDRELIKCFDGTELNHNRKWVKQITPKAQQNEQERS